MWLAGNIFHLDFLNTLLMLPTATTICDIAITACMVYCFLSRRTGIKSTDTMLTRLTRYAIETGLATTVVAITDLILYHRYPTINVHLVPCYILTKAYTNSLLAVSSSSF